MAAAMGTATGPGETHLNPSPSLPSFQPESELTAMIFFFLAKFKAVTDLVNKLSDDVENISLLPKGILSIHYELMSH